MKFQLVDRIDLIDPGRRIVSVKALSLAEEYLADHFPAFPVLPGVLMIEAMVQSAAWLVRIEQDFAKSIVVLSAARNVRYGSFVRPGSTLRCEVDVVSIGDSLSKFKAVAFVNDGQSEPRQAVSTKLELRSYNLADSSDYLSGADAAIIKDLRRRFELIAGSQALAKVGK